MALTSTVPAAPVVALAGGVGGAKLSYGLYHELPPDHLSVVDQYCRRPHHGGPPCLS